MLLCMPIDINKISIYGLEIIWILSWFGPAVMKFILHIKIYLSNLSYNSSVQLKIMYEMYIYSSSDICRGQY